MNALGEPVASRQDSRTNVSRLREIPYNYTSFRIAIVIRLLGAPLGVARAARRSDQPLSPDAVRARRHLGRRAESLRDDLSTTEAPQLLVGGTPTG
jgi:hypothetical protein